MSKDYTKYAKVSTEVEAPADPIPEKVFVTGTNVGPIPEVVEPTVAEVATTEDEVIIDENGDAHFPMETKIVPMCKTGRVSNCAKLNVRKAPDPKADVICELFCHTEVEIDEVDSTDDFYKICTASGIVGFCMKAYITVK